jgi:SAM-dependent methyltransferase
MGTVLWGQDIAEIYDVTYAAMFEPAVLDPVLDVLAGLAGAGVGAGGTGNGNGRALELAIGTGRVALPLSQRGVEVAGIELSPSMVDQLRAKPGADAIEVVLGDMSATRAPGEFAVVYLVANTIMNVTTQAEQVAVLANAAAHLQPGGCFVIDVIVPQLRRVPPGEAGRVFAMERGHVGIETFDDQVGQIAWSHHWFDVDGRLAHHAAPYRYVWPAELDLMARLAGLSIRSRWSTWAQDPFTNDSTSHVSIYQKPA